MTEQPMAVDDRTLVDLRREAVGLERDVIPHYEAAGAGRAAADARRRLEMLERHIENRERRWRYARGK